MKHSEIIDRYGLSGYQKIMADEYMNGITISLNEDNTIDIPEEDVLRAWKHIRGGKISAVGWD